MKKKTGGVMNATQDVKQDERARPDDGPVGENVEREGKKAVGMLKRKPAIGVVLAGGLGVLAASVIGVGEVAIALAAGYAAYRVLHA